MRSIPRRHAPKLLAALLAMNLSACGGCNAPTTLDPVFVPIDTTPLTASGPLPGDSTTMRRMTNRQVAMSIADLLSPVAVNTDTVPFPAEIPIDGFENNERFSTATPSLAESLHAATLIAARNAWSHYQATQACELHSPLPAHIYKYIVLP